ncbi:MAG: YfhO family protein, partial [Thermoanaerobaculia bacterium]
PKPLSKIVCEKGSLLLVVLAAGFFSRALFLGESFFLRDLYKYYLPQRALQAEAIRGGEIPFWNPFLHGGSPFLADLNTSAFYPSNLIYLLLEPRRAMVWEIVLHVAAAAVAAYLLARVLGLRQAEATAGGVVFAFCGYSLASANILGRLLGGPYLPLLILFLHLALQRRQRRWWWLALAAGTLQTLAGAPEMIACGLLGAFGWSLFAEGSALSVRRRASYTVALGVAVAGVAAFQLVPFFELVSLSARGIGLGSESVGFWSLAPRRLPELAIPGFLGPPTSFELTSYWGWKIVDLGYPYFLSLYLGAVPLVLALIGGLFPGRLCVSRRLRGFLLAQMVLGIVLSLGRFLPGFESLVQAFPILSVFRYPTKMMTLAMGPLAILTACGVAVLRASDRRQKRFAGKLVAAAWLAMGLPAAAFLLGSMISPGLPERCQMFFFETSSPEITAGLRAALVHALAIAAVATLVAVAARRRRPWQPWVLALILALDLGSAGADIAATAPAGTLLTGEPDAVRPIREILAGGRFFRAPKPPLLVPSSVPSNDIVWLYRWNQEILRSYLASAYSVPMIFHDDFNKLAPRRVSELTETVRGLPWSHRLRFLSSASVRAVITHEELALPELERVAVLANASPVPFYVYRNSAAAERARVVQIWITVDSEREALEAMLATGFDPARHAVVEGDLASRPRSDCQAPAQVESVAVSNHRRRWRLSVPCSGLLVLGEILYPGWEATVDGRAVPPVRADQLWAAVPVDAGEHVVEWRYVPRVFYLGSAISLVTLVLFGAVVARRARSQKNSI